MCSTNRTECGAQGKQTQAKAMQMDKEGIKNSVFSENTTSLHMKQCFKLSIPQFPTQQMDISLPAQDWQERPGAVFNGCANNLILILRHVQTIKKWLRLLLICYMPRRIYARKSIYTAIESRPCIVCSENPRWTKTLAAPTASPYGRTN